MAATALAVQVISESSVAPAANSADVANGNSVPNLNGDVFLLLKNADVSNPATCTITAQNGTLSVPGYGPMTKANLAVVVAFGTEQIVGPFKQGPWNDGNGNLQLTYSGAGDVNLKVSPFRLSNYGVS